MIQHSFPTRRSSDLFENDLRRDRQMDGISHARKSGVKFGRKKSLTDEQVVEMRQKRTDGLLIKDLMTHYGLSKASVYRALGAGGDVLE